MNRSAAPLVGDTLCLSSMPNGFGIGEAPEHPDPNARIVIDPMWSPRQLSFALIRANGKRLLAAALLLIMFDVASMLIPTIIGHLVDEVATPAYFGASFSELSFLLMLWMGALIVAYSAMNIGYRFGSRIGWMGVQRGQFELSQAVLERVLSPRGFHGTKQNPGQLLAVATGDAQRACQVLYIMVYPPGQIVALIVAAVTLAMINLWLGIGIMVGLPVMLALMHVAAMPLRQRSLDEQHSLADATGAAADLVAGSRVLAGLHAQETAAARFRVLSRHALDKTIAARGARAAFEGITTTGAQLFVAIVTITATSLAFKGLITPGELITATSVAVMLIYPVEELVGTLGTMWAVSQASSKRVLDLVAAPPHPATAGDIEENSFSSIAFHNLDLGSVVLNETVQKDEFVVLDLPQDAGQCLADILTLSKDSEQGCVTVEGLDLNNIVPECVREQLLVLPHRPGVFAGTILDNIQLATPAGVTTDQAYAALDVASLNPDELQDGFDSIVGDSAWELSGGQRQRIALARGVAATSKILVLIDPTTSVDAVTEQRLATRLRNSRQGRMTIVISSAPVFHAVADRVIAPHKRNCS